MALEHLTSHNAAVDVTEGVNADAFGAGWCLVLRKQPGYCKSLVLSGPPKV